MNRPPDETIDTGTPIEALRDIQVETQPGFFGRLRNKIDRRLTTRDFVAFSWDAPREVIVEFIKFLFHWFDPVNSKQEKTDERPTHRSDE